MNFSTPTRCAVAALCLARRGRGSGEQTAPNGLVQSDFRNTTSLVIRKGRVVRKEKASLLSTIADFIRSGIMAKSGYIIYLAVVINVVPLVHSVASNQPGNAPS